jgi:N-acetylmuramoyl-L-alanine amidase
MKRLRQGYGVQGRLPAIGPAIVIAVVIELLVSAPAVAQTARERYESLVARDSQVRAKVQTAPREAMAGPLTEVASVVAGYEALVRKYPTSGYADNALWQAATLTDAAYQKFGRAAEFDRSMRLYRWLTVEYPTSAYVDRANSQKARLQSAKSAHDAEALRAAAAKPPTPVPTPKPAEATPLPAAPAASPAAVIPAAGLAAAPMPSMLIDAATPSTSSAPPSAAAPSTAPAPVTAPAAGDRATLNAIQRMILSDSVRVTLELDREVSYREEWLSGPERVFFDLRGVQLTPALRDKVLSYPDDVVNKIRVGRHPDSTVRVVLDLERVRRYSVFTLYNPFRLVIDCERTVAKPVAQPTVVPPASTEPAPPLVTAPMAPPLEITDAVPLPPAPPPPVTPPAASSAPPAATPPASSAPSPAAPAANGAGGFSIARQLGLGVGRVVIDPGHGGHDPGAQGKGLDEADLVLDVALRLEKLLLKENFEVTLTRRTDVFIPLEERTAIANRLSADLFLSIHANASRTTSARGIETYYLSFASSPDAEALAARENATSDKVMHNLPDIIKAISLNNKLDESRDLARMVQTAMFGNLAKGNKGLRDLGVKKAPFVVLIGAGMPSVLSEISFVTNRQDLQLLKTSAYKDKIATSLAQAVIKYRRSLKGANAIASQP